MAQLRERWRNRDKLGVLAWAWLWGVGDHMPKGGIAVSVTFPDATASYKPLRLRLPRRPAVMLEGATDTPEYRIEGRTHGWNVNISIDIRSSHPTAAQLEEAQRVVASIRFG